MKPRNTRNTRKKEKTRKEDNQMVKTGRANDVFTPKGLYIKARGLHPGVETTEHTEHTEEREDTEKDREMVNAVYQIGSLPRRGCISKPRVAQRTLVYQLTLVC